MGRVVEHFSVQSNTGWTNSTRTAMLDLYLFEWNRRPRWSDWMAQPRDSKVIPSLPAELRYWGISSDDILYLHNTCLGYPVYRTFLDQSIQSKDSPERCTCLAEFRCLPPSIHPIWGAEPSWAGAARKSWCKRLESSLECSDRVLGRVGCVIVFWWLSWV